MDLFKLNVKKELTIAEKANRKRWLNSPFFGVIDLFYWMIFAAIFVDSGIDVTDVQLSDALIFIPK